MKIPEETICSVCRRIFCCEKCRIKHEIKNHAIRIRSTGQDQLAHDPIYVICPLCSKKPFPLHEVIYKEMLDHIKRNHLPLHCQKCAKIYEKIDDLREFSKCIQIPIISTAESTARDSLQSSCILKSSSKSVTSQKNNISTQTSPPLSNQFSGISSITPIFPLNVSLKDKSKDIRRNHQQDITDSVSSIKNISSISNSISLRRSNGSVIQIEAQGKLVRTTSTPLHADTENSKPKEQTFNILTGQVSSIYNSGCDSENQTSMAANVGSAASSIQQQSEAVNIYRKFNGRTKIAAVTPLRQVMSKSIQKAFAEHGLPTFHDHHKASEINEGASAISDNYSSSPLDLRLSPALRRSQNNSVYVTRIKFSEMISRQENSQINNNPIQNDKGTFQKRIIAEEQSIMITRTQQVSCCQTSNDQYSSATSSLGSPSTISTSTNSIYHTCQSYQIINSTRNDSENGSFSHGSSEKAKNGIGNHSSSGHNIPPITPITRLTGSSINKKVIKFDTPKIENKSNDQTSIVEKFYTPKSGSKSNREEFDADGPMLKLAVARNLGPRFWPSCRPSIHNFEQNKPFEPCENENNDNCLNDEVFLEKTKSNSHSEETKKNAGFLKTIVNSVMRFPSLKEKNKSKSSNIHLSGIDSKNLSISNTSLLKRCASVAGSLVRSTSLMDEKQLQTLKRKRTHTIDSEINTYRPVNHSDIVSSMDVANHDDFSSTKRFRIQGRKPIERMRKTQS